MKLNFDGINNEIKKYSLQVENLILERRKRLQIKQDMNMEYQNEIKMMNTKFVVEADILENEVQERKERYKDIKDWLENEEEKQLSKKDLENKLYKEEMNHK